jgi:hypothetical protein
MERKTAAQLLKQKLPLDLTDRLIDFAKGLPPGMAQHYHELLFEAVPEIYYADRMEDQGWIPGTEWAMGNQNLLMVYSTGISPITGYYDGEVYRNAYHTAMPPPYLYKYIQLPS